MADLNIQENKKCRLLVLGGTGFIGKHVCSGGVSRGYNVTSISKRIPNSNDMVEGVSYYELDIKKKDAFSRLNNSKFDYVVFAAGEVNHKSFFHNDGLEVINVHLNSLYQLVAFLDRDRLQRLLYVGSADEYGSERPLAVERVREAPFTPYSYAKTAGSHFLQMLYQAESYPAVICRLFLVYGPGQNHNRVIPQIIKGCESGELFETTAGEQKRDFCYIDDVVDGLFSCLTAKSIDGNIVNLASGNPVKIRSIIEKIVSIIGKGRPAFGSRTYREGESMNIYADIEFAKNRIGWAPKINLDEGLKLTIKSMVNFDKP